MLRRRSFVDHGPSYLLPGCVRRHADYVIPATLRGQPLHGSDVVIRGITSHVGCDDAFLKPTRLYAILQDHQHTNPLLAAHASGLADDMTSKFETRMGGPLSPRSPASETISSPATSAPPTKPKRALRILCFGDSLTSGYTAMGYESHPYATALSTTLASAFPKLAIDPIIDGRPGDTVSGRSSSFLPRIERHFLGRTGGIPYDWTIVLGGTNDLAYGITAYEIYMGLREAWNVALGKGSRVLACTVPEAGGAKRDEAWERMCARRDALNTLIKGHRQENFYVFDLKTVMPLFDLEEEEVEDYWDDRVHMTPKGYDVMGQKIAAAVIDVVMPPGRLQTSGTVRPNRRRRLFKDDEHVFEEEEDGALLGKGYVVVRRKDLD